MDWLDRMKLSMDYIENNLSGNIDYNQAAQFACCSTYHYQRMFSFIIGIPLSEYIRRRRLTLAAFDLQEHDVTVTDTAIKYGYDSIEAFTRAFKKQHNVVPSAVRNQGIILTAYPRISFHISIKGDVEMKFKIEQKEAFKVFGVSRKFRRDGDYKKAIGAFWGEVCDGSAFGQIEAIANAEANDERTLALIYHGDNGEVFMDDGETTNYLIGAFKTEGMDTKDFYETAVPAATWAVFPTEEAEWGNGMIAKYIQETFARVFSEWFPTSDYEHAELPELEVYIPNGKGGEHVEIWIPVRRKA